MEEILELLVSDEEIGMRMDAYLSAHTEFSRSRIAALIQEGVVFADGKVITKSSLKTVAGQNILMHIPEVRITAVEPQNIPIDILYQDDDVVIVNKACGMVVHPAAGNEDGTLVNALLYHVKDLSGIGGEKRPGIVHRLDKDTSGLILIAKNDRAHAALSKQFKERSMEKHYHAVVSGNLRDNEGFIDAPIARHPTERKRMAVVAGGRSSQTQWRMIEQLKHASYLDVHLLTGRTHQIRVHMHSIGHPLLGDQIYAPNLKSSVRVPRLMLHAYSLSFTHPSSGKRMTMKAPLSEEFDKTINKLR